MAWSSRARRGRAKGAPPDPSRNAHVEKGRPVAAREVALYRLPLHEKCRVGRGILSIIGHEDGSRTAVPCKCATKRFFAAHPEVIIDKAGAAWWPAKEA